MCSVVGTFPHFRIKRRFQLSDQPFSIDKNVEHKGPIPYKPFPMFDVAILIEFLDNVVHPLSFWRYAHYFIDCDVAIFLDFPQIYIFLLR